MRIETSKGVPGLRRPGHRRKVGCPDGLSARRLRAAVGKHKEPRSCVPCDDEIHTGVQGRFAFGPEPHAKRPNCEELGARHQRIVKMGMRARRSPANLSSASTNECTRRHVQHTVVGTVPDCALRRTGSPSPETSRLRLRSVSYHSPTPTDGGTFLVGFLNHVISVSGIVQSLEPFLKAMLKAIVSDCWYGTVPIGLGGVTRERHSSLAERQRSSEFGKLRATFSQHLMVPARSSAPLEVSSEVPLCEVNLCIPAKLPEDQIFDVTEDLSWTRSLPCRADPAVYGSCLELSPQR